MITCGPGPRKPVSRRPTSAQASQSASPTGTQAVDRASHLLTEIVDAATPRSFSDLAAATGLAKSTTSRLLFALERNGLVRRGPNGTYAPGAVFVRYAGRGGREFDLIELAYPHMQRLGELTGETINLGIARRGQVEQLSQVDSRYLIGTTNWVGKPVPLHASALGKVLLAFGAATIEPGRLARLTERTITSRAALAEELTEVCRRGYAVTIDELERGLIAVAAPVFKGGGEVIAAVSVSGPANRLTSSRIAEAATQCRVEAAALSAVLGHRPRQEGAA
ncbi:MAG: IclR family transcriptional regulator [Acidimicrobiales bacterium]